MGFDLSNVTFLFTIKQLGIEIELGVKNLTRTIFLAG